MVAWRYGIYLLAFKSKSYPFAALTRKISSLTLEEKFHISARPFIILYRSIAPIKSKLQHHPAPPPPPRAGHLTIFCAQGVGNLTGKAFPMVGNLTFAWVGWGKLNWKGQVSNDFFSSEAPNSLTAINTCFNKMEEFEERDIAIRWMIISFCF